MLNLSDVKKMVIANETELLLSVNHKYCEGHILGMAEEINCCDNIDQIVSFYEGKDYTQQQCYQTLIGIIMAHSNTSIL